MPLSYHLHQFRLKNAWIQQMGSSEWDFFTPAQNPCGELKDPENAKLACKLRHGTAFCRVKCAPGFMPENTKEKSQWCRNGRWMPRKTPTCVEDPTSLQRSKSYAYGRSQRSRLNPDIAEMMRLFGDEFLIDPITETGTCTELPPIQNGVHWCDDDQNDKSVCSLLCQTGSYSKFTVLGSQNIWGFHAVGPLRKKCSCKSGSCEWSPLDRSFCRPNPTCRPIESPENGRVDCPTESLCVVSCDLGYEMDHGLIEKTLTCDCDINDYRCTWNKPVPKCRRK